MKNENEVIFKKTKRTYITMMSLFQIADKLFGAIYIAFMRSRNMSIIQITRLFSIEQILLAFFDLPTGIISDKYGRKRIAAFGFITWGIGIILFGNASNFLTFLPSMILMALGLALISGAPIAWLIDQMIDHDMYEKRNQILSKTQTAVTFFSIIASIISYYAIDIEHSLSIILAGVISISAGIFALCFGQDNFGQIEEASLFKNLRVQVKLFINERKLVLLSIRSIITYVSFVAFVLFWQIYATEIIGIKTKYLAFLLILFMFMYMIGNYSVGVLTKKISSLSTAILGIAFIILGFALFIMIQNITFFVIAAGLIEIGFGMEQVASRAWSCDYVKSETRATTDSIFSTVQAIGGFLITNLLGIVTDSFDLNFVWIIAIISLLLNVLFLVLFNKKYKNSKVI